VDFTRWPAVWRYALALAAVAVVVAIVLLSGGDDADSEPAGWYTVVVRIGAVALLAYGVLWLGGRLWKLRRRR